jgi:hypothetical protein
MSSNQIGGFFSAHQIFFSACGTIHTIVPCLLTDFPGSRRPTRRIQKIPLWFRGRPR